MKNASLISERLFVFALIDYKTNAWVCGNSGGKSSCHALSGIEMMFEWEISHMVMYKGCTRAYHRKRETERGELFEKLRKKACDEIFSRSLTL